MASLRGTLSPQWRRSFPSCAVYRDVYVLLYPVRSFVMVYLPSGATDAFNRFPLHSVVASRLAIIFSSVFTSLGIARARCPCQMSSSPGDLRRISNTETGPPLRGPLFMSATRGWIDHTNCGEFDRSRPWCVVWNRSTFPITLLGQMSGFS